MRVWLMIEGQEDVTWPQWLDLVQACERHGVEGMFRSDHYDSVAGAYDRGSLDAWATLAALGAATETVRLGTLVSPVTFRHPSVLAKSVVTADHVAEGRVELGMGAGWNEHEHEAYGFAMPDTGTRLDLLAEQLEIVHRQWSEDEFDFDGAHYRLRGCRATPRPLQDPHPPLLVGGEAGPRSAALCARWADEYNTIFASPEVCRERRSTVENAWREAGRAPSDLAFSLMTGCLVGRDGDDVRDRARRLMERSGQRPGEDGDVDDYLDSLRGQWVVGTIDEAVEHLRALADAGVDRVMLQHLLHTDLDVVEIIGQDLAPAVA